MKTKYWTEAEIYILKEYYPKVRNIYEIPLDRTAKSIAGKAHKLKLKSTTIRPGKMGNFKNKTFGYLTVLDYAGDGRWLCRCICGVEKSILSSNLKKTKSCGCKSGVLFSKTVTIPGNETIINGVYAAYRSSARDRKFEFSLSYDVFRNLILSPCHYCGVDWSIKRKHRSLTNSSILRYNGVDRKDSLGGYTNDNCVTCCKTCNYAKLKMTYLEFNQWLDRISDFRNKSHRA